MALYRLHRKEWDKDWHPPQLQAVSKAAEMKTLKRKRGSDDTGITGSQTTADAVKKGKQKDTQGAREEGRKGISSGLSTVVKRASGKGVERIVKGHSRSQVTMTSKGSKTRTKSTDKWWATLGGGTSGSKGSI
jgi:RNA exonuclease 4